MIFKLNGRINSDNGGFAQLIRLHHQTQHLFADELTLDMENVSWFSADMCAAFGAILYRISSNLNTIELVNLKPGIETILSKNGFLSNYGRAKSPDTYGTTIEYQRFETKDDRYFGVYIEESLGTKQLPAMSVALWKKFRESIFEIFGNAVTHSETYLGIFACGQYYPTNHLLNFSIADLGIGIREVVLKKKALALSAPKAIQWATEDANTTKTGNIPGGLGLKLLREFITKNGGCLRIVSDSGAWELTQEKTGIHRFTESFPGTVVNIQINTADTDSYCLASEVSNADIF